MSLSAWKDLGKSKLNQSEKQNLKGQCPWAPKKNTSHENEVLPQDTIQLIQRPCYQRGRPCQDPGGNRATRRPRYRRKETQTAVVWSFLTFIRSGQKPSCKAQSKREKTTQTDEAVGRQHQGMDRPVVRQVPQDSGEQGKMEETGCEIICGAPTTLASRDRWDEMVRVSLAVSKACKAIFWHTAKRKPLKLLGCLKSGP